MATESRAPKITDVSWVRYTMAPVMECEGIPDPEGREPEEEGFNGTPCGWRPGMSYALTGAELNRTAKEHCLAHPGHVVLRQDITETTFEYRKPREE